MARFTVRVELQDASREQYNKLYERMAAEGFTDEIQSETGAWYELPDAEYSFIGSASRDTVLENAKRAAAGVVKYYKVLVTESAGRTWHGLDAVK